MTLGKGRRRALAAVLAAAGIAGLCQQAAAGGVYAAESGSSMTLEDLTADTGSEPVVDDRVVIQQVTEGGRTTTTFTYASDGMEGEWTRQAPAPAGAQGQAVRLVIPLERGDGGGEAAKAAVTTAKAARVQHFHKVAQAKQEKRYKAGRAESREPDLSSF